MMHRSEPEMIIAAEFANYEWWMFTWAAGECVRIQERCPQISLGVGTGNQVETEAVLIEAALLHGRNLREFLGRRRADLRGKYKTDIIAEDFFDEESDWMPQVLHSLSGEPHHDNLNQSLAHLSYERMTWSREWDFLKIYPEVVKAWRTFLDALRPWKRDVWFPQDSAAQSPRG